MSICSSVSTVAVWSSSFLIAGAIFIYVLVEIPNEKVRRVLVFRKQQFVTADSVAFRFWIVMGTLSLLYVHFKVFLYLCSNSYGTPLSISTLAYIVLLLFRLLNVDLRRDVSSYY
jgi:hypothetical protein